ncbi:hypothetical protein FRB96_008694 [Tulasnella sp. 330]|nr:hypothetical protein FRB96_008694 [Tulasnella sp. 330]KAG8875353.1 hypothetical protein FRB97_005191 [Tulasnella sp. 331]KAG8879841.1 hypothetical protein FRB98_005490 [Tulasnella sp. 332]
MKRRATVHDVAALHVHSDGTRATKKNKHKAIKDALGNVIAIGHNQIKPSLRRKRQKTILTPSDSAVEQISSVAYVDDFPTDSVSRPEAGHSRSRQENTMDSTEDIRTKRRRQHDADVAFLEPIAEDESRLAPESDFLKTIHYLAAKHYESRGVLYNAYNLAKVVEQEKRDKRKKKGKATSSSQEVDGGSVPEPAPAREQHNTAIAQRKRRPRDAPMKDMYQAFSGEMLIAMGECRRADVKVAG